MDYYKYQHTSATDILADPAAYFAACDAALEAVRAERGELDRYWQRQPQRARIIAQKLAAADALLRRVAPGTPLTFEGSCPSGNTYSPCPKWDGTPEARAAVLEEVKRYSHPDAWAATLVELSAVQGSFNAACMRTGTF